MSKITLKNITHIYNGKVKAVDNLSMEVDNGKLIALLGPSGCGKTTLMRIIAGLIRPTTGDVYFDEDRVTDMEPEQRNVAMVFQFPVVYATMTVYDNLAFPLRAKKLGNEEIRRRVKNMAEFLEITPYLNMKAGKLNAALKQLTSLGRALIRDARCVLLDEPLTNIDPSSRLLIREKILKWRLERKQTTIYVTHDQSEALTLGEMIAVMNKGVLLQYDTPYNVYEKPANSFIAYFIGNPGMNLIECSFKKVGSKIVFESGCVKVSLPYEFAKAVEKEASGKVILGIRPEHIKLSKQKIEDGMLGTCVLFEDMGVTKVINLQLNSTRIRVKNPEFEVKVGESLYVTFPEEHIRIFNLNGEMIL
jgi:ABC-type sugar transport system ATPase subunit